MKFEKVFVIGITFMKHVKNMGMLKFYLDEILGTGLLQ